MNKIFTFLLLLMLPLISQGVGFADETLHYVVSYKWGLVHKDAADATLSLRGKGQNYRLMLTAKTKPWADRVFKVRDTLLCDVSKSNFLPLSYSKISHEGGDYRRDDIHYSRSGGKVSGGVTRTKIDKKGQKNVTQKTLYASGEAYDMLSVFYFLRTLDYKALAQRKTISTNIFSGSKVELLTIRYVGTEKLKLRNGSYRDAIKISFSFTTDGRKKSSDNIEAWLSADTHIPLQLIGKLPVGSVRVYLV